MAMMLQFSKKTKIFLRDRPDLINIDFILDFIIQDQILLLRKLKVIIKDLLKSIKIIFLYLQKTFIVLHKKNL